MSGGCTSATENDQAPHATRNVRANATARQEGDFQNAARKIGGPLKKSRAHPPTRLSPYEPRRRGGPGWGSPCHAETSSIAAGLIKDVH